jgi:preprotein translocase subunit SecE
MSEGKKSIPVIQYLAEVRQELHRVSWPTREQTIQKTTIVVAVSLIVGLYIGALDFVFTNLMTLILGR